MKEIIKRYEYKGYKIDMTYYHKDNKDIDSINEATHVKCIGDTLAGKWWNRIELISPLGKWFEENVFINEVDIEYTNSLNSHLDLRD